jgi:hypothetical protein
VERENAPALAAAIREALADPLTQAEREGRRQGLAAFAGPEAVALAHRKLYDELPGVG